MHILLFMTRGMSLAAWEANGSLTRELALYEAFTRRGHKVSVISWGGAQDYAVAKRFPWLAVYPNRWNLPVERYERLLPLLHAWPLLRCDVIKSNQTNGADLALRAARIWQKPFVSRCGYLWSEFMAEQDPASLGQAQAIESAVFRGAEHCVVTTEAMRRKIISEYALPEGKVQVIPNYIPQYLFAEPLPDYRAAGGKALVCQLGRLSRQKNLFSLVEACTGLPVKLRLIGEGEDRAELIALAERLSVELELLGNVPHEALPALLAEADICTLASFYEGHPKALLEYMARGCAILATDVVGISGLAVHGRNAWLCATDPGSIRQGLEHLLNDAELRENLGTRAREDARPYSLETLADEELSLYSPLAGASRWRSLLGGATGIALPAVRAGAARLKQKTQCGARRMIGYARRRFGPAEPGGMPEAADYAPDAPASCASLSGFSDAEFLDQVLEELRERTGRQAPAEALRLLFDLEARIYPLEGYLAVAYDNGVHTKHRHTRYHDFFVERLRPGETVLDIGCGNGFLAYDMASKSGAVVTGIDLGAANIEIARGRFAHSNVEYRCGDALVDLPSGAFDTVVLSNVLEHLPGRSGFLAKVQTVLRPKRYLIRVPLFERDWRVPLKRELGVEWRLDATHETEYTLESFKDEIEAAGLEIVYQEVRWSEIWCEVKPK